MDIYNFELLLFTEADIAKWTREGHLSIIVGVKITICCENSY